MNNEFERMGKAASIVLRTLIAHASNQLKNDESQFQINTTGNFQAKSFEVLIDTVQFVASRYNLILSMQRRHRQSTCNVTVRRKHTAVVDVQKRKAQL